VASTSSLTREERARFILAHAAIDRVPLLPEIALHLASEVTPLWHATQAWLDAHDLPPPFWAFAWSGGQAIARYVLDHPEAVRGLRVLDFASGGGVVAIAAAKAGAKHVRAVDIDPFAEAAITLNASLNQVDVEACVIDLVGTFPDGVDLVMAGDVCYERGPASTFMPWLRAIAASGTRVLIGDPGRAYLPERGLFEVASYDVPTPIELEGSLSRRARVFTIVP
jgi:predicted nicotinamide N-methyase